jgi:predicted  nucleic acid-binding Zn-ribbon protein
MPDIFPLFQLQKSDSIIDDINTQINSLESEIANISEIKKAEDLLDQVSRKFEYISKNKRERERELDSMESNLKDSKDKMYGGTINTSKVHTALEEEITLLASNISNQEEKLLEIMYEHEKYQQGIATFTEKIASLKGAKSIYNDKLHKSLLKLTTDLYTETPKRDNARSMCEANLLSIYDRIYASNGGIAVAEIHAGRCSACKISIPKQRLSSIKTSDMPIFCDSCPVMLLSLV